MRLLIAFTLLAFPALAASDGAPPCAYFTRADAVFVGKVLKVENAQKSENAPAGTKKVRFQVAENYKGADNPTFAVFTDGSRPLKAGQTWIVFASNDIVYKSFAIVRGVQIDAKTPSPDVAELKAIKAGTSKTSIAGSLSTTQPGLDFSGASATLTGGGRSQRATIGTDGAFNFEAPETGGRFRVELTLPFAADLIWPENLLGTAYKKGVPTVFAYDTQVFAGDCSYTAIVVTK